jgi:hypothetical protein
LGKNKVIQVAIAQGMTPQPYLDNVLAYLTEQPDLAGAERPFFVYLSCYQALHAQHDVRAVAILEQAYQLLQTQAADLDDPEFQRSFLENVPENREVVRLYETSNVHKVETAVSHQREQ